jgi:3-phenylpropionate/trans-cinnamate dioxygenase ferredoxin reductase subunit
LSKGYLLGTVTADRVALRPHAQYRELAVDLVLGRRVMELGLGDRRARLESGASIEWDALCVATGSAARRLPEFEDALYLRELPDAERLRDAIGRRGELSIVGAGFIGCEVAAAAVQRGCRVRVFEALGQPLVRVLGSELGAYLAGVHRARGVDLQLEVQPLPLLAAPLVIGVGSQPRSELAEAAGLSVDRGIVVDAAGRTSAPGVYAAGDVTRFFSPWAESHIRVEHFQTAQRQGFAVGRAMAGAAAPYDEVPWFWSDQYDLNLQYAGAGLPWDGLVVRGQFGSPPFTVFYMDGPRLVAAAGVNDHHTVARARRLMQRRAPVRPEELADPAFDLRSAALP